MELVGATLRDVTSLQNFYSEKEVIPNGVHMFALWKQY